MGTNGLKAVTKILKESHIVILLVFVSLTFPVLITEEEKKSSYIFVFTLFGGASEDFIQALKAFIKPFKAPQRSVKIKI